MKYVVMLMPTGTKPVPFGLFDSKQEAQKWADEELDVAEDETYTINYIRPVGKASCDA